MNEKVLMTTTRVEPEPNVAPAKNKTGNGLLAAVLLGAVFLFFMGFLNVVKSGNLWTETNLLFASLILYASAAALYLGFGVSGAERLASVASSMAIAGWIFTTLAAGHRWYATGHPPIASIYEMLLSFVWTLAILTEVAERLYGVKLIGSVTMPVAVLGVLLMQLLPSDVHPLVPALQSTWLHVHVTLAMLAYAACALSFALALMFLVQDGMRTESFLGVISALTAVVYGSVLVARFAPGGGLNVVAWDAIRRQDILLEPEVRLMVVIPLLGVFFALAFAIAGTTSFLCLLGRLQQHQELLLAARRLALPGVLLQTVALAVFVLRTRGGSYPSLMIEGAYPTSLAASPFILSGLAAALLASLLYLLLDRRRGDLERWLPGADVLDRAIYKTVSLAFPLLTLMIATGAYWANRTWGSYWSWDPKETWAAITWLVYAGYLHMRITRGWRGRRAAYFAILGFAVVVFTFFGVTYLLPGLHAYA